MLLVDAKISLLPFPTPDDFGVTLLLQPALQRFRSLLEDCVGHWCIEDRVVEIFLLLASPVKHAPATSSASSTTAATSPAPSTSGKERLVVAFDLKRKIE